MNPAYMALAAVALLVVGWMAHKYMASKIPSEKASALKLGIKAATALGKLQSTAPEQVAAAAAAQAHEDALMTAFKDVVSKL